MRGNMLSSNWPAAAFLQLTAPTSFTSQASVLLRTHLRSSYALGVSYGWSFFLFFSFFFPPTKGFLMNAGVDKCYDNLDNLIVLRENLSHGLKQSFLLKSKRKGKGGRPTNEQRGLDTPWGHDKPAFIFGDGDGGGHNGSSMLVYLYSMNSGAATICTITSL